MLIGLLAFVCVSLFGFLIWRKILDHFLQLSAVIVAFNIRQWR